TSAGAAPEPGAGSRDSAAGVVALLRLHTVYDRADARRHTQARVRAAPPGARAARCGRPAEPSRHVAASAVVCAGRDGGIVSSEPRALPAAATMQHGWQNVAPPPPRVIEGFIIFEILCQLALISPFGVLRIAFRIASFGASLVMLFFVRGSGPVHPAARAAIAVLFIAVISIAHPNTPTWTA